MTRRSMYAAVTAVVLVLAVGCGGVRAGTAAPRASGTAGHPGPTLRATVMGPGQGREMPNPGGAGDPRLTSALLTRFEDSRESPDLPGATVAMPAAAQGSMFIPMRQVSSPLGGPPECVRWTSGVAFAVLSDFNTRGVQLAVTRLRNAPPRLRPPAAGRTPAPGGTPSIGRTPGPRRAPSTGRTPQVWRTFSDEKTAHLTFSEAIVTGPAPMLASLGDPRVPASCGKLPGVGGDTGGIRALPPPVPGAWAYLVTGSGEIPVWQWVVVVRAARYLLEVRIPNQAPAPRMDPVRLLPLIARAARARADAALG
ncbi:hypothetical protein ACRYCC_16525 [Actinomadura scrupuli]|uniref:hypothetical protein n=1 Tax=Actinomadura scrupuli TaxID=559629 RepID=UPI003D952B32